MANGYTQTELDMIEQFLKKNGAKKFDAVDPDKYSSGNSLSGSSYSEEKDEDDDIPEMNFNDSDDLDD